MELLAICYSGSDSITSANEPYVEFLRPSSLRSVVSFCVYKDYRLCHLQPITVWECYDQVLVLYFVLCIEEVFERAGQICRMLLSCHELLSAYDTTIMMQV